MLKKENPIKLAEVRKRWCVSIYLPVNQVDKQQNRIRLKKLMFEAEKRLSELGAPPLKVARMLLPVELILDDPDFWKAHKKGFAAFLTPDLFVWFSLPAQTQDVTVVTNLKHLLRKSFETE